MIASYLKVVEHIHDELLSLEKTYQRIHRADQSRQLNTPDSDLLIDAIALGLHDFYSGIERVFTKIATTIDGELPTGKNWHQKLIQQMLTEQAQLRPSVISMDRLSELDELRRFRHVVRSVYAFEFDHNRIADLIQKLDKLWEPLQQELRDFAEFLKAIAIP